ncbi:hypothetical protein Glove_669g5 [Diversispora epigaea]|uniref:Uncharacterized protein n=1 Tax=Diversispora epigaea TaxID=1348612 RepID=A0A397G8B4_9GLOM|nr:hypothetical protein Glove_669g5 [Diversispora epigaea]
MSQNNKYHSIDQNEKHSPEKNPEPHSRSNVKEKIQGAIHVTAQKLNLEPRERNPEAAHQDAKTNPE